MNANLIHTSYKQITKFLVAGQLKNAFDKLKELTNFAQIGFYIDQGNELEQNYQYMLRYYAEGIDDPQRKIVYNKLIAKLFSLNSELREELLVNNSSNFEYNKKRYYTFQSQLSAGEIFNAFAEFYNQSQLYKDSSDLNNPQLLQLQKEYEQSLVFFFTNYWLKTNYNTEEKDVFQQIIASGYKGNLEASLLISAVTLNLWRMFDENKLSLLFDACNSDKEQIRQRAIVGLCFVLAKYNQMLPYFPTVRNRLMILADDTKTSTNFTAVITQIIGTTETDKISKRMQEEILPQIAKLSPKLKNPKDLENLLNSDEWEEGNPEWQKMMEDAQVSEQLKELSELQLEGADIYMSTFALLKNFPFFLEFSHWFLPFDIHFSDVKALFETEKNTALDAFMNSTLICNSDKYSFCLSILQMPEVQRNVLKQSFSAESEQLNEMTKDEALLNPDKSRQNISKQYIQDLYRFFKLHPNRSDFTDMFSSSLFMHKSFLFEILSGNNFEIKQQIAEYYFSKNLYMQALELFEDIVKKTSPTASLYQKIGYALQQTSQLEKAIEAYLKADMIQPDEIWTVRKIALCYRLLGNYEKALEFYSHADFLKPKQTTTLMNIALCNIQLERYKEALTIYFKLEKEEKDVPKVDRAIVWCSFVSGNLSQAEYYAEKLLTGDPNQQDFLNAGHIAFCQNRLNDALSLYKQSYEKTERNWEVFLDTFDSDKTFLIANGVDVDNIPLFLDQLQYQIGDSSE